jgi:hypothetical protein
MITHRRALALSLATLLTATGAASSSVSLTGCRGRDAETPRAAPPEGAAGLDAGLEAGLEAGTSAADAASSAKAPASATACRALPDAAERLTRGACAKGSDCGMAFNGCCLGGAKTTRCDYAAMPRAAIEEFGRAVCPNPKMCPKSAEGSPPEMLPFCRAGRCEVVDVPSDAISACERDADCLVRDWACCTPCDASPVMPIAIRRDAMATFDEQVCSMAGSCARCKTGMQGYRARCDAGTKHCVVE